MRSMSLPGKPLVTIVPEWLNGVIKRRSWNLNRAAAVPASLRGDPRVVHETKQRGPSAIALKSRWHGSSPRRSAALFALLLLALVSAGTRAATANAAVPELSASYSTIDYPGATSTQVNGIVRTGVRSVAVVGTYTDIRGAHGFVLSGGVYKTLDVPLPFALGTRAYGINTRGEVVGTYYNSYTGSFCSFEYFAGTYTALEDPCLDEPGYYYRAYAINAQNDVVGDRVGTGIQPVGFLDTGNSSGPETGFDFLSSQGTSIYGINNNATPEMVGEHEDANGVYNGGWHGAVWKATSAINGGTSFDVPGADMSAGTRPRGINDSGQVVGFFGSNYWIETHGFVETNGSFSSVDYPGATRTQALGIDNAQSNLLTGNSYDIVGTYWVGAKQHGFIATVAPRSTNT